jgi:hypothetical protein
MFEYYPAIRHDVACVIWKKILTSDDFDAIFQFYTLCGVEFENGCERCGTSSRGLF